MDLSPEETCSARSFATDALTDVTAMDSPPLHAVLRLAAKLDSSACHRESRPQTNRDAPAGASATSDAGAGKARSPAKARTAIPALGHRLCDVVIIGKDDE